MPKFPLGAKVRIVPLNLDGEVRGFAEGASLSDGDDMYLVRYVREDGATISSWWPGASIESA
jgi:hypothetical protein